MVSVEARGNRSASNGTLSVSPFSVVTVNSTPAHVSSRSTNVARL